MVCMTRFATPSPVEQKNHTIWAEWKTDIVFDRYKNSPLSLIGRDGSSAWLPYTSSVDVKGSHHTGPTVLRYSTKTPSLQCDDDDVGLAVLICRADIWRTRNNALLAAPLTHGCDKPPPPPHPTFHVVSVLCIGLCVTHTETFHRPEISVSKAQCCVPWRNNNNTYLFYSAIPRWASSPHLFTYMHIIYTYISSSFLIRWELYGPNYLKCYTMILSLAR